MKIIGSQPKRRISGMYCGRGFTLIELMFVVLIVCILAAVAIPLMQGRIDSAKWSEGRAMAGTIKTGIRAYYASKGPGAPEPTLVDLGFTQGDLEGKYFKYSQGSFSWTSTYFGTPEPVLDFTITITSPLVRAPSVMYLTEGGFSETP
jgi:prepilin-type N-terminal cleavage/methylation domain-containing protein